MVASNKLTDHPNHVVPIGTTGKSALRTAVIYGANAAGKSNLIKAMAFAQALVMGREEALASLEPFRFCPTRSAEPTSIEFRFLLSDTVFIYGFDAHSTGIIGEWLAVLRGDDEIDLFVRDTEGNTSIDDRAKNFLDEHSFETLIKLASLPLTQDQLLLNRAKSLPATARGSLLDRIVIWFTTSLVVLPPDYRPRDILDRISQDPKFRSFVSQFLSKVSTGISGIHVEEHEREADEWEQRWIGRRAVRIPNRFSTGIDDSDIRPKPDDPGRVIARRLIAEHQLTDSVGKLPFSAESDGTRQLLSLIPILSAAKELSRIFVIDELDRSLHPLICWEFIRFFCESAPRAQSQLIVTTHEAHLLDQDLLRRDEYWFVEKDEDQQSQLVSLVDFKVRNDLQVQKGYLQGRFGAIPVIGSMLELERLLGSDAPNAS